MAGINRRKIHEFEIEKQNYRQHVFRLEKLKGGQSPEQLRMASSQKNLVKMIANLRKFHQNHRQFQANQTKIVEFRKRSNQKDYSKVQSVVKKAIGRFDPLALTSSDKQNTFRKQKTFYYRQNSRPSFFMKKVKQQMLNQSHLRNYDFSSIYENSKLNQKPQKVIKLRLDKKAQDQCKMTIQFNAQNLQEIFKNIDSLFSIQFKSGSKSKKTEDIILGELKYSKIAIYTNSSSLLANGINIIFHRILDEKLVKRAELKIIPDDIILKLSSDDNLIQKSPQQILNRSRSQIKVFHEKINLIKQVTGLPNKINLKIGITLFKNKLQSHSNSFHSNSQYR